MLSKTTIGIANILTEYFLQIETSVCCSYGVIIVIFFYGIMEDQSSLLFVGDNKKYTDLL